jgi:hypothetical protein
MKKQLLYFSFQLFIATSHAQDDIVMDVVNQTFCDYNYVDSIQVNPYLEATLHASYIVLDKQQWPGATKINQVILDEFSRLKEKEFADRASGEFQRLMALDEAMYASMDEEGSQSSVPMEEYDLTEFIEGKAKVEFRILALCDHILIGGYYTEVEFNSDYDLFIPHNILYYDLMTGSEIDPASILSKKRLPEFHKLIKSRVPEHLKAFTDTMDLSKGLPLFVGAGFYYLLEGVVDISSSAQPTLQVRVDLASIVPYLNNSGPFKAYLKVMADAEANTEMLYDEFFFRDLRCLREVKQLKDMERFIERLDGEQFALQEVHISNEGARHPIDIQITFNEKGQKMTISGRYLDEDHLEYKDVYSYHPNDRLSKIEKYQSEYAERNSSEEYVLELDEVIYFDKNQNLIQHSYIPNYGTEPKTLKTHNKNEYFTYLNNRIIKDESYTYSTQLGCVDWAIDYAICLGSSFELNDYSNQAEVTRYTSRIVGDTTFIDASSGKETYCELYFVTEEGRITTIWEFGCQRLTKITYNDQQLPCTVQQMRIRDSIETKESTVTIAYDVRKRPVSYRKQVFVNEKLQEDLVYQLRYQ